MADFRTMKKHKMFLTLKRDLAMAVQAVHMAKELVNNSHRQIKEEEGRRIAAVDSFALGEKRIHELNTKLTEADRERKSAKAALQGAERQVENQCKQLRQTEDELVVAKEHIGVLKKKLEEAENAMEKVKQEGYDVGVAETEETLRVEVPGVCRTYCLQVWNEAVEVSSALRRAENVYYPPAIRASGSSGSKADNLS
ncbi:uncharacterized protein LOC142606742 [Castanea sativa]|uniref:uncharacterized protein LOC142606742 n=1 Tax=Castanea sativa TaxID=21020 RepID=UPI003F64BB27